VLAGAIAIDLLVLAVFKYADFAVGNLNAVRTLAGISPLPLPGIALPIGISFFTFHAISYVVDVYRQDAAAQKRPVEAALYLLVFPQLVAGPIVRYRQIAAQLSARIVTTGDFACGVRRFLIGLAKKMLIANTLARPADQIFAMPAAELTAAHAWTGIACYTLQIYFDFSGYSDMAIGLGRMFGFRFPENFNYPYIASSIQDFWRRWHMSLSAWFRDYVYIPLGGNRTTTGRLYFNLLLVFFLCGLWHGAAWTFVVWGLFHGAFLVIERVGLAARLEVLPHPVRHLYALIVVMVGWVFFRADTLGGATAMLSAMAGAGGGAPATYAPSWYWNPEVIVAFVAGAIGATPVVPALARRLATVSDDGNAILGWRPSAVALLALVALLSASVMLSAARSYNPFIYFRF
jgi:alginate O-acetyltransferase complex protein AlgI